MTRQGLSTVRRGDARHLPLKDASVDLIVTSPPYWALRSYTDDGEHYAGQIGAEPTVAAYINSLIDCTREWMRVLKPSGSLWVNLGDKYAGSGGVPKLSSLGPAGHVKPSGVPTKSLIGLPWRYAIRCVDELGLILRAEVIWSKPNGLPESVTDRVRRSHETWFHLVKSPRYFSAVDAIREAPVGGHSGLAATFKRPNSSHDLVPGQAARQQRDDRPDVPAGHPLGKLPGSVWTVATQPLKVPAELGVDHFAAFPMEWPRRVIQGWSPLSICTSCGEGRRPVVVVGDYVSAGHGQRDASVGRRRIPGEGRDPLSRHGEMASTLRTAASRTVTGEACACPDTSTPARPAVVLDPFGGTGTTALVAKVLGRWGISIDASADYCRLAEWRTNDPKQIERAGKARPSRDARP